MALGINATAEGSIPMAVLSDDDRDFFDANGYLLVREALPGEFVDELSGVCDALYAREFEAGRLETNGKLNMRNCIVQHDAFLKLLDWPATAPLAWQILGWNIQMITSHLIGLPTREAAPEDERLRVGLHRDGGTSYREMAEPHPRIMLKIAYVISDQSDLSTGATVVAPGSNRLTGRPPTDPLTGGVIGAQSLNLNPGDAFLFEQRTWHGEGKNWSGRLRKTVFFGYGYRWVKPMDYIQMPEELIGRCSPIQRQLLGAVADPISYYLPQEGDVPLRALVEND